MRHAEAPRLSLAVALAALLLAACGASPKQPPEPRLRAQAQEQERSGARRYAQGDYDAAARDFAEAARLRSSLDELPAASRNRLYQAQAELAAGRAQAALGPASQVHEDSLQVQALLLQAQAHLALGRVDAAQALLARLSPLCQARCAERGRILLLSARLAWAQGRSGDAAGQAEAALPLLREQAEEREVANAWRLMAAARLALDDTARALQAAQAALELDRQLALPEKIARDWLLIGDIHRRAGSGEARFAYQRAQVVAQAAGLRELARLAGQYLEETVR